MGKKVFINALKFLAFLSLGLIILYFVYQNQNAAYQAECAKQGIAAADCSLARKVVRDFATANYWWLLLMLGCFALSNLSRALRWRMLLEPLGHRPRLRNAFLTIILGYFANLGLPRVGEVVRAGTLSRYENIPVEKVMGTVVVDRIVDVLSILAVTVLALLLESERIYRFIDDYVDLGARLSGAYTILYGLAGIVLLFVIIGYFLRRPIRSSNLYERVVAIARGFAEGIATVRRLDRPWLFVLHSINVWFMYYLMTYVCFFSFAPTAGLSPLAALTVFVFGGWGIVIPSPGGMGTYHFLAQVALGMYGVGGNDAFSWANISFFSIQLGCNISIGLLSLVLLPLLNRGTVVETAR